VTVCIAAICQKDGKPIIILCSDTRLSSGTWGSTDRTLKLHVIKDGWLAQAANRPDSAAELIRRLREWCKSDSSTESIHSLVSSIKAAVSEFEQHSPLYERNCCELLITGFIGEEPIIVPVVFNEKGKLAVAVSSTFSAIGSGANIATVLLNCRNYAAHEGYEKATYMVYEAKRFSEKAEGVGPKTHLVWFSPGKEFYEAVALVSDAGIAHLEVIFNVTGLNGGLYIGKFPEGFTKAPPANPEAA
jgi:20S proteasome alpha/beta subunit